VRRRIVVLSVLAAVLATSLFGVPLTIGVARYYLDDERTELERVADTAAITIAAQVGRGGAPAALPTSTPQDDLDIALYGADGRRMSGDGPAIADAPVEQALHGRPGSQDVVGQLVVAVPVTDGDRVDAVVRAASDYSAVARRIAWTWAAMLGLGTLAVGATWLVARRQARRLAGPLEALSRTAQQLGGGDFSVRTEATGIPEIDSAGSSLNSTAVRLSDLVSRERAFAAAASHQLRTPLTGLRLGLETAVEAPDGDLRAAATAAIGAADRLERTIDDVLSLTRDPGRKGTPLDVDSLVREVGQTWRPVLAAQGRPLRVDLQPDAPATGAAVAAVRQVLAVLLDNAARHGAGTVTLTVRDADGALAFDVADDGPGLDDVVPPLPGTTGHGIGLVLARRLAEAEGGRLWLSRPAPPVFTLLLPLRDGGNPPPTGGAGLAGRAGAAYPPGPGRPLAGYDGSGRAPGESSFGS
jgi:signal transduction histidine kinase